MNEKYKGNKKGSSEKENLINQERIFLNLI